MASKLVTELGLLCILAISLWAFYNSGRPVWLVETFAGSGPSRLEDVLPCEQSPRSHMDGTARFAAPVHLQIVGATVFVLDRMNGCIRAIRHGVVSSVTPNKRKLRPREAQRGPERPRETEKPREAQRGPERPREDERASERWRCPNLTHIL